MSTLLPKKIKKISFILNALFIEKKTINLPSILEKRAKILILVLVTFTLVNTAREEATENAEHDKNNKNIEKSEYLRINLI